MIHIVVCDDEKSYIEIIEYKINRILSKKFFGYDVDYTLNSVSTTEQLKEIIDNNEVDILFLDIILGDTNTINWIKDNCPKHNFEIIFITSYPSEAYNISEVDHSYFLIKSKMTDELVSSALKRTVDNRKKADGRMIVIKSGLSNFVLSCDDIIYLESRNNNVDVHIRDRETLNTYSTLKELLTQLPEYFQRCHKSFVVNLNYVLSFKPYEYALLTGEHISIPPKKYNSTINEYLSIVASEYSYDGKIFENSFE